MWRSSCAIDHVFPVHQTTRCDAADDDVDDVAAGVDADDVGTVYAYSIRERCSIESCFTFARPEPCRRKECVLFSNTSAQTRVDANVCICIRVYATE